MCDASGVWLGQGPLALTSGQTRQRVPQQRCPLLKWQATAGIHWLLFAVLLRLLNCFLAIIIFCWCAGSPPAPVAPNCFWCRVASAVCRVGYYSYYWMPLCFRIGAMAAAAPPLFYYYFIAFELLGCWILKVSLPPFPSDFALLADFVEPGYDCY